MFTFEVDNDITLQLLEEKDAHSLFQLVDYSRDYLREWLAWIDKTKTVQDSEKFIQFTNNQFQDKQGLTLGIFYRGRLSGMVGFNTFDWSNRIGVIGYWLGEEFQGNGIMIRAVTALIDYGFLQLGLNRIEIRAAFENGKSRSIPEKLHFQEEGKIRQGEWLYDHYVDLVMYGKLAGEWK
ncbi:GNAT family N-acetyltransferase [Ornithinibacillus scapharcae]|uniref:GNAT family N-acetyltransferase n=1 Tax=Ornithinibacillus scapharcae TaxID=1147159 RepID=UPI000225BAA2|nr:GNAT family protein [Ornithinibacillus scapharcae]